MPTMATYKVTRTIEVVVAGTEGDILDAVAKADQILLNPTPGLHGFARQMPVIVKTEIEKVN